MDAMFTEVVKITQAITVLEGAAAATDLTGATLDMAGFDGGCCVVQFGPIVANAVTSIKLQQSADTGGSPDDFSDVLGTSQTVADSADNTVFVIDFKRVTKRYVKVIVSRATQNATAAAIYYQYMGRTRPVTQPAGINVERFNAAIEGTA